MRRSRGVFRLILAAALIVAAFFVLPRLADGEGPSPSNPPSPTSSEPTATTPAEISPTAITPTVISPTMTASAPVISGEDKPFRAVWVATVTNLDYPSKASVSPAALKKEADEILDGASAAGFNAVILQVRPACDAFYRSKFFPWSQYLTGNQGTAPQEGFDPLAYWVSGAHRRGLELHAWINPYRVSMGGDIKALSASSPAVKNSSWVVPYKDGRLYFDPGIPAVRKLVVDGVRELVAGYGIDGIHFDDYFYPGADFNDTKSFAAYGAGFSDKNAWRRNNVDLLIKETYAAVHATRSGVDFGVSPFGIWMNKSASAYGSNTSGSQSFTAHYADSRKWVKMKWVDYIAPQIYWHIGNSVADYKTLADWWSEAVRGTGVRLYIGLADYKVDAKSEIVSWRSADEIVRQLSYNKQKADISGEIHFRCKIIAQNKELLAAIKKQYLSAPPPTPKPTVKPTPTAGLASPYSVLAVNRPSAGIKTTFNRYFILGSSDPSKKLYINGKELAARSSLGFYGALVELSMGTNTITAEQGGVKVTRVITRVAPTAAMPPTTKTAAIAQGSAFPLSEEYHQQGQRITLSCTAPVGASVTATLGGKTLIMSPALRSAPADGNIYLTKYICTYLLPAAEKSGITLVGSPLYRMTYMGKSSSVTAPAAVYTLAPGAPLMALVTGNISRVYPGATTTGGPVNELSKGMADYATCVTSGWIRLGMGLWIQASEAKVTLNASPGAVFTSAALSGGAKWDVLAVSFSGKASALPVYDGSTLKLSVYNISDGKAVSLPSGTMFSAVKKEYDAASKKLTYTLTPKSGEEVQGWYTKTESGKISLYIKRKLRAYSAANPLRGMTVMIDAGHGDPYSGALGPLGAAYPEKRIVLEVAIKLETALRAKGATVIMTRSDDSDIPLYEGRIDQNRLIKPDFFVSLHTNSMDENVDCTTVKGLAVFYRTETAKLFAQTLYDKTSAALGVPQRGLRSENFAVLNSFWAPSILVELGFTPNPGDFEILISPNRQNDMAAAITQSIVSYVSRP